MRRKVTQHLRTFHQKKAIAMSLYAKCKQIKLYRAGFSGYCFVGRGGAEQIRAVMSCGKQKRKKRIPLQSRRSTLESAISICSSAAVETMKSQAQ